MKRGQITVFIIIGLIVLFIIGTVLYITRTEVLRDFETDRPGVVKVLQQVQPLQDLVVSCIDRLGTDGLRKIGDSGGYIDTGQLSYNPASPTEGDAVQFSPGAGPIVAYWWYMKSKNTCEQNCIFDSKRPQLRGSGLSIENQLSEYVTDNLRGCLGNFEEYTKLGCKVEELGEPEVTANIAEDDIFFVGKYPLRAVCDRQSFEIEDYYFNIDLNLREIYNLATELTNYESQERILEGATKTLLSTFSEVDSSKLPPIRALDIGPPQPGTYWIKFEVIDKITGLLMAYIPVIQTSGVRNYRYISAPADVRDPERYEIVYNRNFFVPLNTSHPSLEARFSYLDWWKPYFHLNCNGQLCQADSLSNFALLPFTINRYNFAYDLSYPVLVEVRNPSSFNGQGYSFKFFLEQNMRNSDAFTADLPPFRAVQPLEPPSIFCNPSQQTSGTVTVKVKDGDNLKGMEGARVSFICGENNCNLGSTTEGEYVSKFPRCLGGTLRITKTGYASYSTLLDTLREDPLEVSLTLEPVRTLQVTTKNYAITKSSKREQWSFKEGGLLRPADAQSTTIQLIRRGTPYEEAFNAVVEMSGTDSTEIDIIPGKYTVIITALLRENLTIPPDLRCHKTGGGFFDSGEDECFYVPGSPIKFNATTPFPYGGAEYEYELTASMLRGAGSIEFRQFVMALDRLQEKDRIVEDLDQMSQIQLYTAAHLDRIKPVIR